LALPPSTNIILSNSATTSSVTIPDGWYSGLEAISRLTTLLLTILPTGSTITFDKFTNKLTFFVPSSLFINFTTKTNIFNESSSLLFGFTLNSYFFTAGSTTISPVEVDLFYNGRFSQIKVNLLNFSNYGFIGESLTLIKLIAQQFKGTLSTNYLQQFRKTLPHNQILSNISLQLVDGNNNPITCNEPIDVNFLIECYD
jgi:hypothetical protein